jgi:hypothetical protein
LCIPCAIAVSTCVLLLAALVRHIRVLLKGTQLVRRNGVSHFIFSGVPDFILSKVANGPWLVALGLLAWAVAYVFLTRVITPDSIGDLMRLLARGNRLGSRWRVHCRSGPYSWTA